MIYEVVEGWTSRLTFQLTADGSAIDGTGFTVTALDLVDAHNHPVPTSGNFGWATQGSGTVYYDPDASDFVAARGPYKIRYQLTDGNSKVKWFPNGKPDEIKVWARGV